MCQFFFPALQLAPIEPYSSTWHILRNFVGDDFWLDSDQLQLPVFVRIPRRQNYAMLGTQIYETVDLKKPYSSQAKKLTHCHNLQLNAWLSYLLDRDAESVNTNLN